MRKLLDDAIAAEAGAKNDWFVAVFLGLIGDGNQQTSQPKQETHILTPPPKKIVGFLVYVSPFSKGQFSGSRCKKMGLTHPKRNIFFSVIYPPPN